MPSKDEIKNTIVRHEKLDDNLVTGLNVIRNVITSGQAVFQDSNNQILWPDDWSAFQTWLLNSNNYINDFINNFPPKPSLNS